MLPLPRWDLVGAGSSFPWAGSRYGARMSSDLQVSGIVAPGLEGVRAAFEMDPRGGSALTVIHRGEVVVDLREGWRDPARTAPWDADTLVNVYSVGKPVIAVA